MFNPDLRGVLKNHLSRYSLVTATAKRARAISEDAEEKQIILTEKLDACTQRLADCFAEIFSALKIILRNRAFYSYHISHKRSMCQPDKLRKRAQIDHGKLLYQNNLMCLC